MVDSLRRLPWKEPPDPLPDGRGRRIPGGPIYDLATVQQLAADGERIHYATRKCAQNVEDLEWDVDDIARLIAALKGQDYCNSEWCTGRSGTVMDTDAYTIHYDHVEACRGVQWRHPQYYLKFGFRPSDPRLIVWVVSCHLS